MRHQDILAAARRERFDLFLIKVFETLHPGEPPLDLAWYLKAMCYELEQVGRGEERRLVITVPPRHLKSETAAVAFPAWLLGRDPSTKIMVAHYAQDLSRAQAALCRQIMEADWYKRLFPGTVIKKQGNRGGDMWTTAGGGRKAVSVSGSITGFGADLIILDDCMKADEARRPTIRAKIKEWYDNTLLSRLNDKRNGRVVSIQQRLHEDDLPAYLLNKGFRHLNLPAIAEVKQVYRIGRGVVRSRLPGEVLNPAREDAEALASLRREIGPVAFNAQYQQDPIQPGGNLVQLSWFGSYEVAPKREEFAKVLQSWDTAASDSPAADFSVCQTWGFKNYKWYLLDVYRARLIFPDLRRAALLQRDAWHPDFILIEKAGSGLSLLQDLRASQSIIAVSCTPKEDKESRLIGVLGEIEAGRFLLPTEASWLELFRGELRAFPHSRYDDQVDAFTQFAKWQLLNWRGLLLEHDATGRPLAPVRHDDRPW